MDDVPRGLNRRLGGLGRAHDRDSLNLLRSTGLRTGRTGQAGEERSQEKEKFQTDKAPDARTNAHEPGT